MSVHIAIYWKSLLLQNPGAKNGDAVGLPNAALVLTIYAVQGNNMNLCDVVAKVRVRCGTGCGRCQEFSDRIELFAEERGE